MITAGCYESKDGKKISKKNYFGAFIYFGLFMGFTLQTNYVKVHGEPAEKRFLFGITVEIISRNSETAGI